MGDTTTACLVSVGIIGAWQGRYRRQGNSPADIVPGPFYREIFHLISKAFVFRPRP
jgi:hypothetical protein